MVYRSQSSCFFVAKRDIPATKDFIHTTEHYLFNNERDFRGANIIPIMVHYAYVFNNELAFRERGDDSG